MREIKFRAWNFTSRSMYRMNGYFAHYPYCDPEQWAWMQYTGLKDKNGAEIYEGDILLCYPDDFELCYMRVVEWDNKRCELCITTNGRSGLMLCRGASDSFKVIGNIYENPELLGGDV